MRPRWLLAFIILMVCGAYFYIALPDCWQHRAVCFDVSSGTIAPGRYRLLQPALEQAFVPDGGEAGVLFFDFITQCLLTTALFVGLYRWLRQWGSERAITGCLLLAVVMMMSFHLYLRSIGTTIELTCVVWGLNCLHSMRSS